MRTVLLALLLLGCRASHEDTAIDLLDLFPYTDAGQAVREIDLGSAGAAAHLGSGWSRPDTFPDGTAGSWAIARRAMVQLGIQRPAEGRLVVRCGLVAPGAPRRGVVLVSLDGRRLGLLRPGREIADHWLRMPAAFQRPGPNVVQLTNMLLSELPRNRGRERARALAVESIRLDGVNGDVMAPVVPSDGGPPRLVLPPRASVDVFIRLPAAPELVVDLSSDDGGPAVTIAAQLEGEPELVLARDARAPSRLRVPLPPALGAPVRLSFRRSGDGELALVRPRILGTPGSAPSRGEPTPRVSPPNVLLYVIDTLRADHLGCYGYPRPTSPRIDALAARGILFTDAVAQASWTKPATASILTGLEPPAHGASTLIGSIRPDVTTLAELLHGRGYRTAAFVTNVNVRGEAGFRRGFDDFAYLPEDEARPTLHVPAAELNTHVFRWLDRAPATPFFLYVHASDPHAPYRPPPAMLARFAASDAAPPFAAARDPVKRLIADPAARTEPNLAYLRALYDGDVALADDAFGALVARLATLGHVDDMVVVLAADHGEEFLEHGGFEHGRTLYAEQLRVPLVLRLPGDREAGRRVDAVVRQIDVLPTLLAVLDVPAPPGLPGLDVLAPAPETVEAFSHTSLGPADLVALTTADWKVIHRAGRQHERFEVYDRRADPGEQRDLAARRPVLLGYGRQMLARRAAAVVRPTEGSIIDNDSARRLRALGYVSH